MYAPRGRRTVSLRSTWNKGVVLPWGPGFHFLTVVYVHKEQSQRHILRMHTLNELIINNTFVERKTGLCGYVGYVTQLGIVWGLNLLWRCFRSTRSVRQLVLILFSSYELEFNYKEGKKRIIIAES